MADWIKGSVHGERGAAATGGRGVRVAHGEMAAHQLVRVVQFRAGEQIEADGVHQHFRGTALDDRIVRGGLGRHFEFILEARATAGQYGDAHGLFGADIGGDFRYAPGSAIGQVKFC